MSEHEPFRVSFPAIRVVQPIGVFYVGVIDACTLKRMAAADVRRVSERELELYSGVQRELNKSRTTEIAEFIRAVDASFPNSIILNVISSSIVSLVPDSDNGSGSEDSDRNASVRFDIVGGEDTFKIVDGQHRLAGFQDNNCENFDLIVTLFIDLLIEEQAYLFSTINLKQTKVNKSLVYDLFDISDTRSPQKTAHSVVKMLNSDGSSPFYRRIKLLGITPKVDGIPLYAPTLTQGTVVDRLLKMISRDPDRDRNLEKKGNHPILTGQEVQDGLIFRQAYIEDQEWAIYKVMVNYFGAVAQSFSDEWNDPSNPLTRTIGFGALMRLLVPLYQLGSRSLDLSADHFGQVLERMHSAHSIARIEFNFSNFPASGHGELKLFRYLARLANINDMKSE